MTLADLLKETIEVPDKEVWKNERTPTPAGVRGAAPFHGIVGVGGYCRPRVTRC